PEKCRASVVHPEASGELTFTHHTAPGRESMRPLHVPLRSQPVVGSESISSNIGPVLLARRTLYAPSPREVYTRSVSPTLKLSPGVGAAVRSSEYARSPR